MEAKSSILIIGVTGRLGFELAKASLQASHPTFCLVRSSTFSDAGRSRKLQMLSDSGAIILQGSLHDEGSLVEAIRQVTVVIYAVNSKQILDQKPLISAIKKAGCIEITPTHKEVLSAIFMSAFWFTWWSGNDYLFNPKSISASKTVTEVKASSFL